jgi:hypothetical protein
MGDVASDFDDIQAVVAAGMPLDLLGAEEAGPRDSRPDPAAVGPVVTEGGQELFLADQVLLAQKLTEPDPLELLADGDSKMRGAWSGQFRGLPRRRTLDHFSGEEEGKLTPGVVAAGPGTPFDLCSAIDRMRSP